jgi:Uma2 family endonuclease
MPTVKTEGVAQQTRQTQQRARPTAPHPLPLENGARLTRAEFEQRYEAMPHIKKAELIEGVVYMPSPVRIEHSRKHGQIMLWIGSYQAATPGVDFGDNATLRLDADNEVQPDAFLRIATAAGGATRVSEDHYLEGAPELIVEIAASSASYDLYDKMHVYRRNGVQEYIVWRIYDEALDWFQLQAGKYHRLEPDENGLMHSRVFPGLRLDVAALLAGDLAKVVAAVKVGTETAEHADFVQRLGQRA